MQLLIIDLIDKVVTSKPNECCVIKIEMHKKIIIIKIETKILILQTSIQTSFYRNQIINVFG